MLEICLIYSLLFLSFYVHSFYKLLPITFFVVFQIYFTFFFPIFKISQSLTLFFYFLKFLFIFLRSSIFIMFLCIFLSFFPSSFIFFHYVLFLHLNFLFHSNSFFFSNARSARGRIRRLHLCRGIPTQTYVLDMILTIWWRDFSPGIWGMSSINLLSLLSGPLKPRVLVPNRFRHINLWCLFNAKFRFDISV